MLAFVVRIVELVVVKRVQFESLNPNNTSTSVFLTWWDCTVSIKGNAKKKKKKKKKKKEFIVTQQITWLVPNDKEENWQQNEFLQIIINNSKQVQPGSKTDGYFRGVDDEAEQLAGPDPEGVGSGFGPARGFGPFEEGLWHKIVVGLHFLFIDHIRLKWM